MDNKERLTRLKHLRDALLLAIEHGAVLNMDMWIYSSQAHPYNDGTSLIETAAACGTVCCNAGWAGLYPPLRELGLTTVQRIDGAGDYEEDLLLFDRHINFSTDEDNPLVNFFGITIQEAMVLFAPERGSFAGVEVEDLRNQLVRGILNGERLTLPKSVQLVEAVISKYESI